MRTYQLFQGCLDNSDIYLQDWINDALKNVLNAIKLSPAGVFVQASTLGSMEALLEYLRSVKVPVRYCYTRSCHPLPMYSHRLFLVALAVRRYQYWASTQEGCDESFCDG